MHTSLSRHMQALFANLDVGCSRKANGYEDKDTKKWVMNLQQEDKVNSRSENY